MTVALIPWKVLSDDIALLPVRYQRTTLVEITCSCGLKNAINITNVQLDQKELYPTHQLRAVCKQCKKGIVLRIENGKVVGVHGE